MASVAVMFEGVELVLELMLGQKPARKLRSSSNLIFESWGPVGEVGLTSDWKCSLLNCSFKINLHLGFCSEEL